MRLLREGNVVLLLWQGHQSHYPIGTPLCCPLKSGWPCMFFFGKKFSMPVGSLWVELPLHGILAGGEARNGFSFQDFVRVSRFYEKCWSGDNIERRKQKNNYFAVEILNSAYDYCPPSFFVVALNKNKISFLFENICKRVNQCNRFDLYRDICARTLKYHWCSNPKQQQKIEEEDTSMLNAAIGYTSRSITFQVIPNI